MMQARPPVVPYVISRLEKQFGRVAEKEMRPMQPGRRRSPLRRHHGSGARHRLPACNQHRRRYRALREVVS
jgi:hypothetical protein